MTRRKSKWLIRVAFEVKVDNPASVAQAWRYLEDLEADLKDNFGAVEVKGYMAPRRDDVP